MSFIVIGTYETTEKHALLWALGRDIEELLGEIQRDHGKNIGGEGYYLDSDDDLVHIEGPVTSPNAKDWKEMLIVYLDHLRDN